MSTEQSLGNTYAQQDIVEICADATETRRAIFQAGCAIFFASVRAKHDFKTCSSAGKFSTSSDPVTCLLST